MMISSHGNPRKDGAGYLSRAASHFLEIPSHAMVTPKWNVWARHAVYAGGFPKRAANGCSLLGSAVNPEVPSKTPNPSTDSSHGRGQKYVPKMEPW